MNPLYHDWGHAFYKKHSAFILYFLHYSARMFTSLQRFLKAAGKGHASIRLSCIFKVQLSVTLTNKRKGEVKKKE